MSTPATATHHEIFDRALLTRRRDRVAAAASAHDFLLARAAEDIADRLGVVRRNFGTAVVLGGHHGTLAAHLRALESIGYVIDTDSSPRMLAQCGGPRVLADEEMVPFRDGSLDLVASALVLQCVNDLPGTLAQIRRALRPDGLLLAAMLGGRTLFELREAFLVAEEELEGGASPRVAPFVDVRDAGHLLQRAGFALPVADSDTVEVTYATPLHLMQELKAMGGSNVLLARRRVPMRRSTLMHAAKVYADRFSLPDGRVSATFEIVTMTGWAPHKSQQKPLAPGAARVRLAAALGVDERSAGDRPDRDRS